MHEDFTRLLRFKQYRSLLKRSFYFFSWQTCGSLKPLQCASPARMTCSRLGFLLSLAAPAVFARPPTRVE